MAAGLGFKTFTTGEVLTAADVNGYLMQGVLVFATEAARNSAITSPQEGQFAFTKDTNSLWYYSGSAWVASGATGDIEGVTAGTGISGGGTSGTVTITNSMATAIDAKGDLVAGTGADAFSRLAVGSNNTVLTADSAEATGLKWAAPAAASFSGALCKKSTSQTISNSTLTAVTWNSEVYDTDNIHSTVTNTDRFTIPAGKGGYWYISVFLNWNNMTTGTRRIYINKNGSEQLTARNDAATTQNWDMTANGVISCAAADYLSVDVFQTSGGNLDIWGDNLGNPVSWISVAYLGA